MKVLIATEKPFAPVAVKGIKETFDMAGYACETLEKYTDKAQLLAAVADCQGLIVRSDIIDAEVMDAAPELKIIVRAGAGYDNIDLAAATARKIVVMNTPGQNANAVAELVIGLLIYTMRQRFNGKSGSELMGKKMGLMAFGAVAQNVARIAKGMGMDVSSYSPLNRPQKIIDAGFHVHESLEALFHYNDIVSLHCPATPQTIGSIGYDQLMCMKPNSILVNTARAEVIDEEGLLKAMEERQDLRYITDIKMKRHDEAVEKLGDRYVFTPKKMGAQTAEANINAGLAAAQEIVDFIEDGVKKCQVNH
ncbi:MAG: NAD(P)-dependent oxidoreductase [Alloprevotella sp.]|nr:3-phosphoglycerate dehydrogenase [Bacteroidales bacterium]MDY2604805.1 NAD(P)-dependent oxidoreductase [Alloprevotella sp.]MCI6104981.1 3-phosphoglycerate dehydrogenase [Bacteroidales bacterium]MCI7644946.1 3-phosphoglycerate dehydrogenase [Bacteroidales bacterium]MDY4030271.1 NAD(P)-dependent oxidoreductase [Alloprevotella sp.]